MATTSATASTWISARPARPDEPTSHMVAARASWISALEIRYPIADVMKAATPTPTRMNR